MDTGAMQVWFWRSYGSYDGLKRENQRDIMAGRGELSRGKQAGGIVPLCDGAGDIVAVGEGVTRR